MALGKGLKAHSFKAQTADKIDEGLNKFFAAHLAATIVDVKIAGAYDGEEETFLVVVLYQQ